MTDTITITYENTPNALSEAMKVAGAFCLKKYQALHTVLNVFVLLLLCFGGAAIAVTIGYYVTEQIKTVITYIWIGPIVAAALFLFSQNLAIKGIARFCTYSSFGRDQQEMRFDATGMTISNGRSHWQTVWSDVENIKNGKHGLIFHISGVAFSLPKTAVADLNTLLRQLEQWKNAA